MKNKKRTIKIIIVSVIIIILLFGPLVGCFFFVRTLINNALTVKPLVTITDNTYNYRAIELTFWSHPKWKEFNEEYGDRFSKTIQRKAINSIIEQAEDLGEDREKINKCISVIDMRDKGGIQTIPSIAEKGYFEYYTKYRGDSKVYLYRNDPSTLLYFYEYPLDFDNTTIEPCWIFVINWGIEDFEELGHIHIYVISLIDYSILFDLRCM